MSRQQGHRKSQSTSALNVSASTSTHHQSSLNQSIANPIPTATPATPRSRRTQGSSISRLGSVVEDDSERDEHSHSRSHMREESRDGVEGLLGMISSRTPRKERTPHEKGKSSDGLGLEELRAAVGDIRSLRSSDRRRLAALRNIERIFVACCAGLSSMTISTLLSIELHTALISLLTRHAQTLAHRASKSHTTLSSTDSVANHLREELLAIFAILQGLCLVDKRAKEAMGQSWMLETIIDLLLVLRAQSAPEGEKPVVYLMLDLLCCILVDSPVHSRTFESLNGLEGVVRVLKGTGVVKEVRMKCIEFLYFYLLPEQSSVPAQRATSSSSTSTTSSTESQLFPPTPVNDDTDLCPATPSRRHRTSSSDQKAPYSDLDITFVPQTPQRSVQPNLGYLTPSTRRASGSSNISLSVPPSPCGAPRSPSHHRLMSVTDTSDSDNSGLGLGLPRSDTAKLISRETVQKDIPAINLPDDDVSNPFRSASSHTTSSSGSSTVMPGSRGISRSSTHSAMSSATGVSRTSSMRRISDAPSSSRRSSADESTVPSKERAPRVRHSHTSAQLAAIPSESRTSESAKPPRARMSHSRTSSQLSDTANESLSSEVQRPSHRVSRSGTSAQLSDLVNGPSLSDKPAEGRAARPRSSIHPIDTSSNATPRPTHRPMSRSSTSVHLGNLTTDSTASDASRPAKPRQSLSHARTPSLLAGSSKSPSPDTSMPPPPSPNTSMPAPPSPSTSMPPPPVPKPTPRKGFPAGITKGLPSAISSPNFNSPLLASKRIPSGKLVEKRSSSKLKEVKSVEEKKELLGMWLGNVDDLVQGVEKVSFWGSVSKR